ncbi:MAG: PIN domain-containing protein [Planctomycetota bacterium]|nr:PIN domain-containing protein [Planctomycetota bacterium]
MILADTNVWLALSLSEHTFHEAVRDWFGEQRTDKSVLFCRSTQQSFLRLLTTDAVMRAYQVPPMTNSAAWMVYEGLRSDRRSGFAKEPNSIEPLWKRFAGRDASSPKMWMDAYLAAFAITGELQFVTTDHAFGQFDGLDVIILRKS